MNKPLIKSYSQFLNEAEERESSPELSEPVGLAVLGAPAGGKSHTMKKISDIANDARITRTLAGGVDLTVDKLRAEFQSQNPVDQLKGFVKAYYLMKQKAQEDSEEFGKWFSDIKKLWADKFSPILNKIDITVDDDDLLFNGKPAIENMDLLDTPKAEKLIDRLDKYSDYKRVVRYFQDMKQTDAVKKTMDVSYDEAGDEPNKVVANMKKLHQKGYVTDVFLIHPENVATNLVQNFFRVVTGGDGGRDSSNAIVQAFDDIEHNKEVYAKNAEEVVKVKSKDIEKTADPLQHANVPDDEKRGNKPIDVFVEVQPKSPEEAFKMFSEKISPDQKLILKALLKLASLSMKNLPVAAKKSLENLTDDMSNEIALEVIKRAATSGDYNFKYGGVTTETLLKAEKFFGK